MIRLKPGRTAGLRLIAGLMACLLAVSASGGPPGRSRQRSREEVTVTAVEVPVRVLLKGQPVRGLTADDFEVYENGVLQKLTHVEIVSKRIAARETLPGEPSARSRTTRPRVFLVILNVYDYTDAVGKAVDYLFREVFRPGDRAILVSEAQALSVDAGQSPARAADGLKAALAKLKSLTTARTERTFRDLRYEADQLIGILEGTGGGSLDIHQAVNHFVDHYKTAWRDYCAQHLRPDARFYENLIGRVRRTEGEAWAICLQQREMFPQMKNMARLDTDLRTWLESQIAPEQQVRARLVVSRMDELKREFNVTKTVPTDALKEIFLRAGVPFHLVLMKSPRLIADEDFELKEVGQDYEDALKQISRATGGYLAFNNNALEALKEAADVEDYHYVLVYSGKPGRNPEKREIKVRVHREDVEVISLKNYVPPAPPSLVVGQVVVERGILSFAVSGCLMTGGNDGRHGRAEVRVTIYDRDGKTVFDQGKVLEIGKREARISFDPGVGRGDFIVTIRAIDLLANLEDSYSGPISF